MSEKGNDASLTNDDNKFITKKDRLGKRVVPLEEFKGSINNKEPTREDTTVNELREGGLSPIAIEREYNYDTVEKVYRISDVLGRMYDIPYIQKHLRLVGGTALNLIEFDQYRRLSVDLDFNFRIMESEIDWGKERERIDSYIKEVLQRSGYSRNDIKINASYPLTRFDVKYGSVRSASFKVEIGYMNRISFLRADQTRIFQHPKTGDESEIHLPQREELFSEKCGTLLGRRTARDLFDVAAISTTNFDKQLFRKCLVLKNLTDSRFYLPTVNSASHLSNIQLDEHLRQVLPRKNQQNKDMFKSWKVSAIEFIDNIQSTLNDSEVECLEMFYKEKTFNPSLLNNGKHLHPNIQQHPSINYSLLQLKKP